MIELLWRDLKLKLKFSRKMEESGLVKKMREFFKSLPKKRIRSYFDQLINEILKFLAQT